MIETFGKNDHHVEKFAKWKISVAIFVHQSKHLLNKLGIRSHGKSFGKLKLSQFSVQNVFGSSNVDQLTVTFQSECLQVKIVFRLCDVSVDSKLIYCIVNLHVQKQREKMLRHVLAAFFSCTRCATFCLIHCQHVRFRLRSSSGNVQCGSKIDCVLPTNRIAMPFGWINNVVINESSDLQSTSFSHQIVLVQHFHYEIVLFAKPVALKQNSASIG